jgi:prephenate dehydrogenase
MLVAFLGFGLIGGSIARALRDPSGWPDARLVAWTPSGNGPVRALADGVLDEVAVSPADAIRGADLIVLAAPPTDCLELLDGLGGPWRPDLAPGVVITDVASTKGAIMAVALRQRLGFVGGHPMAGRETSGYEAATEDLFTDRPWAIVPAEGATERQIETVEALADACRARPFRLDAATHDAAVAGTSHLPLVLAAALVEAVAGLDANRTADEVRRRPFMPALTAGGWRDMTRLARGDVAMGTGIAVTNASALAARIRDVLAVLESWLADLEREAGPDDEAVAARLQAVRERLERLD